MSAVPVRTKGRAGAHGNHPRNNTLPARQTSDALIPRDNFVFDELHGPPPSLRPPPPPPHPPPPPRARGNIRLNASRESGGIGRGEKNLGGGEKGTALGG